MYEAGSLNQVFNRISAIQQRFGQATYSVSGAARQNPDHDFSAQLSAATSDSAAANSFSAAGSGDIIRMIQLAAKNHDVDPKLAQAVARAESDYSPQAVSPVGAVGVMQLMPETAQSLGVSDINDTRQNIDGGVQYLKQMLNTFQGNVAEAVAAYNAGPQAVKNYDGVPPYAETQAYVAKVLAYYHNS